MLTGKSVLIMGGTGSLGKALVRRLLSEELGKPRKIVVFSRDEAKQHQLRLARHHAPAATDEIIFSNFAQLLQFVIGDVRDPSAVSSALREIDVVFYAAALKQVPTCEYFPFEAVLTNIVGAQNTVQAIRDHRLPIETVIGVSTDKACKPVNVMGMTKAVQERVFVHANLLCPETRFLCVRYGNVLASRGSVVPLFHEQIRHGGPLTITTPEMTRFLLGLDEAVDTVFAALDGGRGGDIFTPRMPSARVTDIAAAMIGDRPLETKFIGIRPGEKVHEVLVSEEEVYRTRVDGPYNIVMPILPELRTDGGTEQFLDKEYSSADCIMPPEAVRDLLARNHLLPEQVGGGAGVEEL